MIGSDQGNVQTSGKRQRKSVRKRNLFLDFNHANLLDKHVIRIAAE